MNSWIGHSFASVIQQSDVVLERDQEAAISLVAYTSGTQSPPGSAPVSMTR